MHGLHLTADLSGCDASLPAFTQPAALRRLCLQAVAASGLQAVGELFHAFPAPGGVTGVVLLAESHLAVHTWPELGAVTLDVYVCNFGADNTSRAEALLAALMAHFGAGACSVQRLVRGSGASEGAVGTDAVAGEGLAGRGPRAGGSAHVPRDLAERSIAPP